MNQKVRDGKIQAHFGLFDDNRQQKRPEQIKKISWQTSKVRSNKLLHVVPTQEPTQEQPVVQMYTRCVLID